VRDLTEVAVAARVPTIADERLKVLTRREPLTVKPGTSGSVSSAVADP
jgi:hypothetical protein